MDMQSFINALGERGARERSNYHLTFGELIEKLKAADDTSEISPKIKGVGAYRGYYSDIALCLESGSSAYKTQMDYDNMPEDFDAWYKENEVKIDLVGTPKELAKKLESLLGLYFDGYKGGYNKITVDTPLWLAKDYGDCSGIAIVGIDDSLALVTKNTNA